MWNTDRIIDRIARKDSEYENTPHIKTDRYSPIGCHFGHKYVIRWAVIWLGNVIPVHCRGTCRRLYFRRAVIHFHVLVQTVVKIVISLRKSDEKVWDIPELEGHIFEFHIFGEWYQIIEFGSRPLNALQCIAIHATNRCVQFNQFYCIHRFGQILLRRRIECRVFGVGFTRLSFVARVVFRFRVFVLTLKVYRTVFHGKRLVPTFFSLNRVRSSRIAMVYCGLTVDLPIQCVGLFRYETGLRVRIVNLLTFGTGLRVCCLIVVRRVWVRRSRVRRRLRRSCAPFSLNAAITAAVRRTGRGDWIHVQTAVGNAQHLRFEYWYWCRSDSSRRWSALTRMVTDLCLICRIKSKG